MVVLSVLEILEWGSCPAGERRVIKPLFAHNVLILFVVVQVEVKCLVCALCVCVCVCVCVCGRAGVCFLCRKTMALFTNVTPLACFMRKNIYSPKAGNFKSMDTVTSSSRVKYQLSSWYKSGWQWVTRLWNFLSEFTPFVAWYEDSRLA